MKNKKEEKYLAVSEAILRVLYEDGLSNLNLSRVAKISKVSRAWIYQYMGRDRADLIRIAAESCSSFFSRSHIDLKQKSSADLKQLLYEGAEFSIRTAVQSPIFLRMYFKFKGSSNLIGKTISKYEAIWIENHIDHFKKVLRISEVKAEETARTILMLRFGICHQLISELPNEKNIVKSIVRLAELQILLIECE
jgi:hypothetical protein